MSNPRHPFFAPRRTPVLEDFEARLARRQMRQTELLNEIEATKLYRRQRVITQAQYKKRRDALKREFEQIIEEHQAELRSREIGRILREEEERRRIQLEKKRKEEKERREKQQKLNAFIRTVNQNFARREGFQIQFGNDFITDDAILGMIIRQPGRWNIQVGNQYYVLNDKTRVRLRDLILNQLIATEQSTESDKDLIVKIHDIKTLTISPQLDTNQYLMTEGEFFRWTHTTHYDFSRYGIFKQVDQKNYDENCLMWALMMADVDAVKLEDLKLRMTSRSVPKKDLEMIAQLLQVRITLKTANLDKQKTKPHEFGKQFSKTVALGILENHYFLIEPTQNTRFSLEHYDEVKEQRESHHIVKFQRGSFMRDKSRCIDSYELVKILLANKDKLLKEISMNDKFIAMTQFYDKVNDEITTLDFDEQKNIRPVEMPGGDKGEYKTVFFDFETYCENGIHVPYLGVSYDGVTKRTFYGENCALNLLMSLKSNTRLIAHNANYDYRFLIQHLGSVNELSRGNRLISCNAVFNGYDIHIKDSLHLISMPLSKFPKTFGMKGVQKEVMFYDLYNRNSVAKRWFNKEWVAQNYVKEESRQQFYDNIDKWMLENENGDFDIIEYSRRYCEIDCEILAFGYNTFRQWILDLVKIDIDGVLTIASLAHRYFIAQDCYKGVNELSGIPQMFIQGSVVGGRTMVSENKKKRIEGKINDFDAVSLYPSAMRRMDGFLKGKPKVLTNLTYDFLKQQDGYFVDIRITGVGVHRKFPLMSFKNENGVRMFTNDMVGKIVRVDRYTLEDLIQFQGITFEVLRGYYFNEGFNNKINEVINFLFVERLRLKKEGNPAEQVYKLIMNSGYGKSIMKPVKTETRFFDNEEKFQVFLSRHYNWVSSYIRMGNKIKVTLIKTLDEHFNISQVGTMILSMSKRIMNEVMCLAEDNGLEVYYQDTDSNHILDKDIEVLARLFKQKYGRELIGKGFGQFHSDFEIEGAENVYSRRAIFLGKKCYIDELVGEKDGKQVIDYHIRMKGIPNQCILYWTEKLGYKNPFELYEDLYKGVPIEFDLTNEGKKVNFKYEKNYSVRTLDFFKRKIQF